MPESWATDTIQPGTLPMPRGRPAIARNGRVEAHPIWGSNDLQADLQDDEFAISITSDDVNTTHASSHHSTFDADTFELQITYYTPTAHQTPTLDTVSQTTETAELNISWTEDATNFDNATQPVKTNSTVWTGDTFYINTPLLYNST